MCADLNSGSDRPDYGGGLRLWGNLILAVAATTDGQANNEAWVDSFIFHTGILARYLVLRLAERNCCCADTSNFGLPDRT